MAYLYWMNVLQFGKEAPYIFSLFMAFFALFYDGLVQSIMLSQAKIYFV
jgi:hypothetical protein